MTQLQKSIVHYLHKALELSGADSTIIGIVGSWGSSTLTETEVERGLIEWVENNDKETKAFAAALIERLDRDA